MKLKMFSVFDSKTEAFMAPFFSLATGSAMRSFETAANEEGHDFQKFGGDYSLFEIGAFDQFTGALTSLDAPINLGLALTFTTNHPDAPPAHLLENAGSGLELARTETAKGS